MAELYEGHTIKAGDALTLSWDLGAQPVGFTGATVVIGALGQAPIVNRAGVISGQEVSIDLTALETAVAGEYRVEVELTPGPVTHPSDGWVRLTILDGLN